MTRYEVELTDEQASAFAQVWRADLTRGGDLHYTAALALADAIRANPPRMAEPERLPGALVKDEHGYVWVFDGTHWGRNGLAVSWEDVAAVSLVREGWTP